jgi:hypothetical protein
MPEEPEVESGEVRKVIEEAIEQAGGPLLKRSALTTALLARLCRCGVAPSGGHRQ